ncbi:MAG: Arc family DNA-binding protein [Chloroflexi bacterium]|nr:Arc family DNA-binding protein [Chloroflexota bacterium]
MPVNLSVKNVPDELAEKVKERAKRHHRSLQGEMIAIMEEAVGPGKLSLDEAERRLRGLAFETGNDSTAWVREMREPVAPKGLWAAVGAWAGYEELDQVVEDIYRQREEAQDRPVVLEG